MKAVFHTHQSHQVRGCISAQLCAHFFIFCTFFAPTTIIGASRKNSSQILSFHTFPWSDVFWKIWEAPPRLPDFCELEGVVTPNSGSSFARSNFFVHTVARKIPRYIKFLRIENLNTVLRRFQVNIKQSFSITLFCRNTFLLIIEASRTKMGICDVPALRALIQKKTLTFWKARKMGAGRLRNRER